MSSLRVVRLTLVAVVALYLLTGVVWTLANLATVPQYGDTVDHLEGMRSLEVGSYRGFAYPLLLAVGVSLTGNREEVADFRWGTGECPGICPTPPGLVVVELFQLVASLFSLGYFLYVFSTPPGRRGSELSFALLLALLFFDPLVSHFNLSIMPDGLALAASLAFVAALTDLVMDQRRPRLATAVLATASFIAAGLRPEKRYVLLATLLVTMAVWYWRAPHGVGRRGWLASGLAITAVVVSVGVQSHYQRPSNGWSAVTVLVHQRIVYPHLSEIYPKLPDQLKSRLSAEMAEQYDTHIIEARRVVNRVAARNAEFGELLTVRLARIAAREKWGAITLDVAKDSLENFFATLSFYGRLALVSIAGEDSFHRWFKPDGSYWTYTRLQFHSPRLSQLYVGLAALTLVLAGYMVTIGVLRRPGGLDFGPDRKGVPPTQELLLRWTPAVVFAGVNGFAFAATADLVHIRYALFAHVAFLTALYSVALDVVCDERAAR